MTKNDILKELAIQNAILNNTANIVYADDLKQNDDGTDTVHTLCEGDSEFTQYI